MDNEHSGGDEIFEEPIADENPNQSGLPLCPNCLTPCSPHDYYCPNCGSNSPVNPLATYMPLQSIRFEAGVYGQLWRKCWSPQTHLLKRIAYILVFVLFVPVLLVIGLPVLLCQKPKPHKAETT
ncbi:MAG: hypothetical protein LLF76_05900 [Planctomycetaceae bacterium]|nr:hypothetical protein [Planctomycetaceae bacterium]